MNLSRVGDGKVVLLAGGGKIYTDIAARFVRSERTLEEIVASPYDRNIVRNILESGHKAAVEFDYFVFGVEGYSRVAETQLVRKRLASYLIKSGRPDKKGKRSFDMVLPDGILDFVAEYGIYRFNGYFLLSLIEAWYQQGIEKGFPEEELRYLKPQATEFKGIIGMNAHALLDWFQIRCCQNAQTEMRDLANKMMALCKDAAPDLFANAGPSCRVLGYCPENSYQNERCKGRVYTKKEALNILQRERRSKNV